MSCTLQDLQKAEYDILCRFADFCEQNNLNYFLEYGTMLGAVRHNGFIPWDDDIDVTMDIKSFKKFIRLFKKNPIPGLHLTWIDTEPYAPFPFAKLRMDGTYMPETGTEHMGLHEGVWIDIFTYVGTPKHPHLAALQAQLYMNFLLMTKMVGRCAQALHGQDVSDPKHKFKFNLLKALPARSVRHLRKFAFWLVTLFDRKNSENVLVSWWLTEKTKGIKRSHYEPLIQHVFEDRVFNIPKNYDAFLTKMYGDYMTPVPREIHTQLDNVVLKD